MGLIDKIKKIRRKPEDIRMHYIWALTIISLILVLIVWLWSFSLEKRASWRFFPLPDLTNSVKDSDEQKRDIQNTTEMINDSIRKAQEEAQNSLDKSRQNLPSSGQDQAGSISDQKNSIDDDKPDLDSAISSQSNLDNTEGAINKE